jgi:predicted DNA-binding transcriptional regulator AlpA
MHDKDANGAVEHTPAASISPTHVVPKVSIEDALSYIDALGDDAVVFDDGYVGDDIEEDDSHLGLVGTHEDDIGEHLVSSNTRNWWRQGNALDMERLRDSLPFWCPPGYTRDDRGVWRYASNGVRVPGARDRTLANTWDLEKRGVLVGLSRARARCHAELSWMTEVEVRTGDHTYVFVEKSIWDALSKHSLGVTAPELSGEKLWDAQDVAMFLRVKPATVWSYVSRDGFPAPVSQAGRAGMWSEPLVVQWYLSRPGQGSRSDVRNKRSGRLGQPGRRK